MTTNKNPSFLGLARKAYAGFAKQSAKASWPKKWRKGIPPAIVVCKKCGKIKKPGDVFIEDDDFVITKQGGEGYGGYVNYKRVPAGELCLSCWCDISRAQRKDLREIEEMEVMKVKIDIASRLLEKQNQKEEAMRSSVTLGAEYKDKITGFKGVCTGYCEYISGCNQALLTPRVGKDGKSGGAGWYDVQRLERIGKKIIKLDNIETPGCDMAAPVR